MFCIDTDMNSSSLTFAATQPVQYTYSMCSNSLDVMLYFAHRSHCRPVTLDFSTNVEIVHILLSAVRVMRAQHVF